jgi:outer membrane protein OmpA-like peptidoglycan-associated protein
MTSSTNKTSSAHHVISDFSRMLNMKKITTLFFLLLLIPALVAAQGLLGKRADKSFDRLAYAKAAEMYTRLSKKKGNDHVYERLGDCYRLMGQTGRSESWYGKVAQGAVPTATSLLHYAEALRANGKYAESESWMQKYYAVQGNDNRAKLYTSDIAYYDAIKAQQPYFSMHSLDVNTAESDFGATFYKGKIVFASSRVDRVAVKNVHTWNNMPFLNLYVADRDAQGNLSSVNALNKKVNTRYHEGPACFTPDGNVLYFTRNNYFHNEFRKDKKGINNLKIFRAKNVNGNWQEENLSINSDEFSVGHPTLSPDGKYLYFVSDMPGGKGMTDIYRVQINVDGSLGTPENLGDAVNTEGREMFPFLDTEGNLFFSSDGQVGLGGLDVFYSATDHKNGFSKVINVGLPVNSSSDDFALVLDSANQNGYFSSNREGGKGDDDLYALHLDRPFKVTYLLKGFAKDKISGAVLASADVMLKDKDGKVVDIVTTDADGAYQFEIDPANNYVLSGTKEKYFPGATAFNANELGNKTELSKDLLLEKDPGLSLLVVLKDKADNTPVANVKIKITDNFTGKTDSVFSSPGGSYRMPVTGKKIADRLSYNISFEKSGYLAKSIIYNAQIDKEGEILIEASLDKISVGLDLAKIIDIKPIYFDLGKSIIRPDAAKELDKIVKVMNENPNMIVELGSHTDCRGTATSNMALSDKRAKASAEYIKKRITNPERIYGKGYGESQLTNGCQCEGAVKSTCPEEEHQKNRRTEFKIIKM